MSTPEPITVSALIKADPARVWALWTEPQHICRWNAASDDWHTPRAENDPRTGGAFSFRMEAKDGSMGFDMAGTYLQVETGALLVYLMGDRQVEVRFSAEDGGTRVVESFDPDGEYPREFQQAGWQAILDNFKRYAETA